jgi:hypothetical protein
MVSTPTDIINTLREMQPDVQASFPVTRMALFGSWARQQQTDASDVDILVEVDPSIGLRFVDLAERLEERLQRRVDLVSRRAIKPALWKLIEPELIDAWA